MTHTVVMLRSLSHLFASIQSDQKVLLNYSVLAFTCRAQDYTFSHRSYVTLFRGLPKITAVEKQ